LATTRQVDLSFFESGLRARIHPGLPPIGDIRFAERAHYTLEYSSLIHKHNLLEPAELDAFGFGQEKTQPVDRRLCSPGRWFKFRPLGNQAEEKVRHDGSSIISVLDHISAQTPRYY
jgi:hypothetical protein